MRVQLRLSASLLQVRLPCKLSRMLSTEIQLPLQLAEVNERLGELRAGAQLVSPAERAKLEAAFAAAMGHWSKRRRMFRSVWCAALSRPSTLPPCPAHTPPTQSLPANPPSLTGAVFRRQPSWNTFDCLTRHPQAALRWCRDQVSENVDQNTSQLLEEMGVETDEAAGADHSALQQLLPSKRARH